MLFDLPDELLLQIFDSALTGEDISFQVACGGATGEEIQYGGLKPGWSHAWVPDLRLVSSSVNIIVSPLIAKHVTFRVRRTHATIEQYFSQSRDSLSLAKLCPEYMASRVERIVISDGGAAQLMSPIRGVDLSRFKSVKTVVAGPFDIARSLQSLCRSIELFPNRQTLRKYISDLNTRLPFPPPWPPGGLPIFLQPVDSTRHMLETFTICFGAVQTYRIMMENFGSGIWCISRDKFEGLAEDATLLVRFRDSQAGVDVSRPLSCPMARD